MSDPVESVGRVDIDALSAAAEFRVGIAALAAELGQSEADVLREARSFLEELRTAHSPRVHRLIVRAGRALCRMGYERIDCDPAQVARLKALVGSHPSVVLSSHRSYMDGGALTVGFDAHDLPPLTVFAGINMAFWPVGAIWRLANNVFIRRGRTGPVYKYVLRQYLGHLLDQQRHLQWFIEGTRSRSGRLGQPRLGLLVYVLESWADGRAAGLALVPASVHYDQLRDVDDYVSEARGDAKQAETLSWLVRFVRGQRGRFGSIYVRFGEPILVDDVLDRDARPSRDALLQLAFEVNRRIALATPVTGVSLVATVVLAAGAQEVDAGGVHAELAPFLQDLARRGVPRTASAVLPTEQDVAGVLDALTAQGLLQSSGSGTAVRYRVVPGREVALAFYRNTILHFLLEPAIVQLALLAADDEGPAARSAAFTTAANELGELLAAECFLRDADLGLPRIETWLERLEPHPRPSGGAAAGAAPRRVADLQLPSAVAISRSHFESLYVVARVWRELDASPAIEVAQVEQRCRDEGECLLAAGVLRCPDAVTMPALRTAIAAARRYGLLAGDAAAGDRRAIFTQRVERSLRDLERLPPALSLHD